MSTFRTDLHQPTEVVAIESPRINDELTIKERIFHVFVNPCLEDGEPYAERSRKIAVICLAAMACNAIMVGIPLTVIAVLFDPDVGLFITGITCIVCTPTTAVVPYVYLRRTRRMPQWMVDFQLWTTIPSLMAFILFMHEGPVTQVCTCVALVAILLRVRLWYLYLGLIVVGNAFNHIVVNFKEELPQLHSAMFREQYLFERIALLCGAAAMPLTVLGLALHGLITDFVCRADQADAAIAMNLAIAEKLQVYDTQGVTDILRQHKGKIDESLFAALTSILSNLEEYRPHIPDYVIQATLDKLDKLSHVRAAQPTTLGEGDAFERVQELHSTAHEDGVIVTDSSEGSFLSSQGGKSSMSSNKMGNSLNSRLSRSGASKASFINVRDDINKRPHQATTRPHSTVLESASVRPNRSGESSNDTSLMAPAAAHFFGRATTVFVRFVGGALESGSESVSSRERDSAVFLLSKCVDVASNQAKMFGGAMQYLQGCGLMVSFNAASRVMIHEQNACLFALAVQEDIDFHTNGAVGAHISIATTPVLSLFAGNRGQLMLSVLGTFMPIHAAMHACISRMAGFSSLTLVSPNTLSGMGALLKTRLIGAVIVCSSPSGVHHQYTAEAGSLAASTRRPLPPIHLIQLMPKKDQRDKGSEVALEEWMYDLVEAPTAKDPNGDAPSHSTSGVEVAVRLALERRFSEAIEALRSSECGAPDTQQDDVVVRYLNQQLHRCLIDTSADIIISTSPIRMW